MAGANVATPIQIVEPSFPAKARVAYQTSAGEPQVRQQVWLLPTGTSHTVPL